MRFQIILSAAAGGLVIVGLLLLLQAVMRGFVPAWTLPFSAWWGLLLALPGLAIGALTRR